MLSRKLFAMFIKVIRECEKNEEGELLISVLLFSLNIFYKNQLLRFSFLSFSSATTYQVAIS